MRTYTAIEAARELGISEKTIRRWIDDNKLQANKTASGRLAIPESEITRLQLEREQDGTSDQDQDQTARLEDLENKYNALLARVTALEVRDRDRDQFVSAPAGASRTRPARETRAEPGAASSLELFSAAILVPPDIPPGSVLYADFAQQHGMNPHTFRDHLTVGIGRGLEEKEKVSHLVRPIPNRSEVERWLSPDQQEAAVQFWQRHGKKYIPCPACPHRQEQVSVTQNMTAQDGDSAAQTSSDL